MLYTAASYSPDVSPDIAMQINTAVIAPCTCIFCMKSIQSAAERMTVSANQSTPDARPLINVMDL
jgi:hypothetical protein